MPYPGSRFQATSALESATSAEVKAAVAGATHYVTKIVITIYAFQNDGTISLTDGTSTFFEWLASTGNGGHIEITFDPANAFSWGTGKAINMVVGTSAVKCKIVVMGFTRY